MEEVKKQGRPEKLSYEQLENVAHQLSEQVRQLYAKLREVSVDNMFKRLDYLFKVLDNRNSFDSEFISKCVDEIKGLMTIPEKEEDKETPNTEEEKK